MNKLIKLTMTLALLLTASTGAWAQSASFGVKELTADMVSGWSGNSTPLQASDLPGFVEVEESVARTWTGAPATGKSSLIYNLSHSLNYEDGGIESTSTDLSHAVIYTWITNGDKLYYTAGIDLTSTDGKVWTFTDGMPAGNVTLKVTYCPSAEVVEGDQVPTAAEGISVGSESGLVTAGTFAQGTGKYKVTTTNSKPDTKEGFSATIPTGQDVIIQETGPVYVWYYIVGDDTHNDSEILGPVAVTLTAVPLYVVDFAWDRTDWEAVNNPSPQGMIVKLRYNGEKRVRSVALKKLTTYSAPTLRTGSDTYNATSKDLLANNGTVANGTLSYSYRYKTIGGSSYGSWSDWSTEVPTGTNAGVYEVKYKVEPDEGFVGGIDETSLGEFTINKAPGYVTLSSYSSDDWFSVAGAPHKNVDITVTHHMGTLTYSAVSPDNPNIVPNVTVTISNSGTAAPQHTMNIKSNDNAMNSRAVVTVTCPATDNYTEASATYHCN